MSKQQISEIADQLLNVALPDVGYPGRGAIPVDEILELHLGLELRLVDLREMFGDETKILGGILFHQQAVLVDENLSPELCESSLGRYRFTLAHEIGHWCLHRDWIMNQAEAQQTILCRDGDRNPEEWQANYFAACLLMPGSSIRRYWIAAHKGVLRRITPADIEPADYRDMMEHVLGPNYRARQEHSSYYDNSMLESYCSPMAVAFQVSPAAMRIRLESLGLMASF